MEDLFADIELTEAVTTPIPAPIDYTQSLISINSAIESCSSKIDRLTSVSILLFVVLGVTLFIRCALSILR